MIAHIFGKVSEKFNSSLIIDVGGVGYEVAVPMGDFDKISIDDEVKFYTYHHIREQSQELFGFSTLSAKKLFEMLISVQGVGPKAGLAIMSLGDAEMVRNAVASADSAFIQQATGVGKRTAERVVVDLSDKVGPPTKYGRKGSAHQLEMNTSDEAVEALMALGFTLSDASVALAGIDTSLPTSERVRLSLQARNKK